MNSVPLKQPLLVRTSFLDPLRRQNRMFWKHSVPPQLLSKMISDYFRSSSNVPIYVLNSNKQSGSSKRPIEISWSIWQAKSILSWINTMTNKPSQKKTNYQKPNKEYWIAFSFLKFTNPRTEFLQPMKVHTNGFCDQVPIKICRRMASLHGYPRPRKRRGYFGFTVNQDLVNLRWCDC